MQKTFGSGSWRRSTQLNWLVQGTENRIKALHESITGLLLEDKILLGQLFSGAQSACTASFSLRGSHLGRLVPAEPLRLSLPKCPKRTCRATLQGKSGFPSPTCWSIWGHSMLEALPNWRYWGTRPTRSNGGRGMGWYTSIASSANSNLPVRTSIAA